MSEPGDNFPDLETSKKNTNVGANENDPLIGVCFDSRFEIIQLFGSGASGTAYKANDVLLQREVAIKIIHPFLLSNSDAVERFKREAATCIALSHSNLVRVYKQGVSADGRLYMVMDYLEGESLAQIIAKEGKLDFDDFCDIFLQIIDALSYAHHQGVVHRDIKPNNIVVANEKDGSRRAVLVDLGVAKFIDQGNDQGATKTGAILGSSAYMSPEQIVGSAIDGRADIYSLGCVMLESLVGQAPFQGESALDVMYKHLNESLSHLGFLKKLPESISRLIEKCLQKDPAKRYQTIDELKIDFGKCIEMRETLKRRLQLDQEGKNASLFPRLRVACAFVLGLLLIFSAAYYFSFSSRKSGKKVFNDFQKKKHDAIPSPEKVYLPYTENNLNHLLENYSSLMGAQAAITILKRWEIVHAKDSEKDLVLRAAVDMQFVSYYAKLAQEKEALAYAEKVYASPDTGPRGFIVTEKIVEMYLAQDKPRDALAYIEQVSKRFHDFSDYPILHGKLLFNKSNCETQIGHFDKAAKLLQEAIGIFNELSGKPIVPDNLWRGRLITALCLAGRKPETEAVAKECLQACENYDRESSLLSSTKMDKVKSLSSTYSLIAECYKSGGDSSDAIKYYTQARELSKANGDVQGTETATNQLIAIYNERGEESIVRSLLLEMKNSSHSWWETVRYLCGLSQESAILNERQVAFKYAQEALDICDQHLREESGSAPNVRDELFVAAASQMYDLLRQDKKYEEADKIMELWIDRLRACGDSAALASIYVRRGYQLSDNGDGKRALEFADKAIELWRKTAVQQAFREGGGNPEDHLLGAYVLKAQIQDTYGDYLGAIESAKIGLSIRPTTSLPSKCTLLSRQGNCLLALGKPAEATKCFDLMLEMAKANGTSCNFFTADMWRQYAMFESRLGKFDEAERLLLKYIDCLCLRYGRGWKPLREYYCNYASLLLAQNRPKEAIAVLRKSLALCSGGDLDHDYWYGYTLVLLSDGYSRSGDLQLAEKFSKELIALHSWLKPVDAYYQLAYIYSLRKDQNQRESVLKKGIELINSLTAYAGRSEDLAKFEFELADLYLNEKRYSEADPLFEKASRSVDEMVETGAHIRAKRKAQIFRSWASSLLQQNKPEQARKYFRVSIENDELQGTECDKAILISTLNEWLLACKAAHADSETAEVETRLGKLR